MKLIIYGLIDPRDGAVHYIGKSSSGKKRPREHGIARKLDLDFTPKARWIRALQQEGLEFGVVVLEQIERREDLAAAEIRWIAFGRSEGWPLKNITEGGDGRQPGYRVPAEEVERARREWALGIRKHKPETIEKLRALKLGVPRSEETKAKIREARLRQAPFSVEVRQRMSEIKLGKPPNNKGMKMSTETRAKMSAAHKARHAMHPVSAETREKIAASKRGRACPDLAEWHRTEAGKAHAEKLRQITLARWAKKRGETPTT